MTQQIVVDILQDHPLYFALTMTVEVPDIYLQQFWHTVAFTTRHNVETIVSTVDSTEVTVTLDEF